jgi:hypothetical protein
VTSEELDEILDSDWNDAVDAFNPPETSDENEDAFQDALREMVRDLQRVAFERGTVNGSSEGVRLDIRLGVGQSKALVKAMLNDDPVTLALLPFE